MCLKHLCSVLMCKHLLPDQMFPGSKHPMTLSRFPQNKHIFLKTLRRNVSQRLTQVSHCELPRSGCFNMSQKSMAPSLPAANMLYVCRPIADAVPTLKVFDLVEFCTRNVMVFALTPSLLFSSSRKILVFQTSSQEILN